MDGWVSGSKLLQTSCFPQTELQPSLLSLSRLFHIVKPFDLFVWFGLVF
jgi:hypothetical protein